MRRAKVKEILKNPDLRRDLLVGAGMFLQHLEGINTTKEQMEAAYDKVRKETEEGEDG